MTIRLRAIVCTEDCESPVAIILKIVRMLPAFMLPLDTSWGGPNILHQFFDECFHVSGRDCGVWRQ